MAILKRIIFYFKRLLSLSYSESRAFSRLLLVCIVAISLIFLAEKFINPDPNFNQSDKAKLDSLVSILETSGSKATLFSFDPNKISSDSLIMLGLPQKVAERVVNFRNRGGSFKIKKDIAKIYGLNDDLYGKLYPFILLPDSLDTGANLTVPGDINKIDWNWLNAQVGIEPDVAGRIIRYRDRLGGFVNINQLGEIPELQGVPLENLKKRIFIRKDYQPKKIKINLATREQLMAHPYISRQLAEDIVRFKELNGSIKSEKLLAGFKSLDKDNYENLILYLDFQ